MFRVLFHTVLVALLTLLSQLGGVAWLIALLFKNRLLMFLVIYAGLSLSTIWIAPFFGRVALACSGNGPLVMQS